MSRQKGRVKETLVEGRGGESGPGRRAEGRKGRMGIKEMKRKRAGTWKMRGWTTGPGEEGKSWEVSLAEEGRRWKVGVQKRGRCGKKTWQKNGGGEKSA